jgi:hypothetical protein
VDESGRIIELEDNVKMDKRGERVTVRSGWE